MCGPRRAGFAGRGGGVTGLQCTMVPMRRVRRAIALLVAVIAARRAVPAPAGRCCRRRSPSSSSSQTSVAAADGPRRFGGAAAAQRDRRLGAGRAITGCPARWRCPPRAGSTGAGRCCCCTATSSDRDENADLRPARRRAGGQGHRVIADRFRRLRRLRGARPRLNYPNMVPDATASLTYLAAGRTARPEPARRPWAVPRRLHRGHPGRHGARASRPGVLERGCRQRGTTRTRTATSRPGRTATCSRSRRPGFPPVARLVRHHRGVAPAG